MDAFTLFLIAAPASWILTAAVRHLALKKNIIDQPNQRSSHTRPTPRGGGLGLVLVFWVGAFILWQSRRIDSSLFMALSGGLPVALAGWLDDLRPISARARLAVHAGAALWLLWWLPAPEFIRFGAARLPWGILGQLTAFIGIIWLINSYNFMDGIDGLAGGEALTVALGGAWLGTLAGRPDLAALMILLAAAALGFLAWNWPPAKIFMGDVSSGFLGYLMGFFWLAAAGSEASALWWWPLMLGVFLTDATLTLVWRMIRKQKLSQAHSLHSYQFAARKFGHLKVTAAVMLINCLWLIPLAYLAFRQAETGLTWAVSLGGLVPLTALWWAARR